MRFRRTGFALLIGSTFVILVWLLWGRSASVLTDPTLTPFVRTPPPCSVVFTSRSEPMSLIAPAPTGEGFRWPGQPLWQAREGRLRLLTTAGEVAELSWDKVCDPEAGRLIDVMSPSISFNARRIIFAARAEHSPFDRFRLYEIGVDGKGLRRLTGGPDDEGCTVVPPLRFGPDGEPLTDAQRRQYDYDDVDPTYLSDGRIIFASSRVPDLGRGHARRSTQLWSMNANGTDKKPITSNRNNDRWPYLLSTGYLGFSLWSRNVEVITADRTDIQPHRPDIEGATSPTDAWLGAMIDPVGERFGNLVKTVEPVWRPRPLFNGRMAFMTPLEYPLPPDGKLPFFQICTADRSIVRSVPSATPIHAEFPTLQSDGWWPGPIRDAEGKRWSLATPSPCPDDAMLVAAAISDSDEPPDARKYGIAMIDSTWESPVSADALNFRWLFDDPNFVDAEPVAIYLRPPTGKFEIAPVEPGRRGSEFKLANGRLYTGPAGNVVNPSVFVVQNPTIAGNTTDMNRTPIYNPPPQGSIREIRIFASHRDRFDSPTELRIEGQWEPLLRVALNGDGFDTWVPSGIPTVLAGFDADGKVAKWQSPSPDKQGRRATFYAYAGDHYSGTKASKHHFCLGCHPGHSAAHVPSVAERITP